MTHGKFPSTKANRLLAALLACGYREHRRRGSHRILKREDGKTLLFTFHEKETIGPSMVAKVFKDAAVAEDHFRKAL